MKPKSKILVRREREMQVQQCMKFESIEMRFTDILMFMYSSTIFIYAEEGCVSAN